MEYVYYILITLVAVLLCLLAVRRTRPRELPQRERRPAASGVEDNLRRQQALKKQLKNVPTPWGWPARGDAHGRTRHIGSLEAEEVHGASEVLHQWADLLKTRKKMRDSEAYKAHCYESLRTMLEDGYGLARDRKPIEYRKVKPPLLRDPSAPHDQMDNFPSGKTRQIEQKLTSQPRSPRKNIPPMRQAQYGGIKKF
jgi:hypothetical protein